MPSLLDILLSNDAAKAICWTLVHSLWEGAIAALAAGAIILATRKQPAALRYNLLTATIALFIIVAGSTFFYELKPHQQTPLTFDNATTYTTQTHTLQTGNPLVTTSGNTFTVRTVLQRINDFLNTYATLVTGIWLGCLLAQLLRLSGGLYRLHRLRHHSTIPATTFWTSQLATLARQLGIKRTVTLLQSRSVKAPSAFGFLRPAILVPLGFLAQLPAHQVETILLHELAHIRRNDYLSNISLHLTEAVFFFNPGIRWIATLIRREREACCDDIVLARTPDRHNYFEALVAFTQLTIDGQLGKPHHNYLLQLGGSRRSDLLWRVRRMLEKENKRLHLLEKTVLSFALFALVSFSLVKPRPAAISKPTTQGSPTTQERPAAPAGAVTPAPAPEKLKFTSISHNVQNEGNEQQYKATAQANDGHTYEIRKHNDEILFFKIDGRRIAKENYVHYLVALAEFDNDARECAHMTAEGRVARLQTPTQPVVLAPTQPVLAPTQPVHVSSQSILAPTDPVKLNRTALPVTPVDNTPRSERPPTPEDPVIWSPTPDINILHIAIDLIKIHLITDVNKYAFYLDPATFTVNGVPVPDSIAQQFRKKYVLGPDYNFEYSQYWTPKGSGSHCIVHTPNHSADLTNQY